MPISKIRAVDGQEIFLYNQGNTSTGSIQMQGSSLTLTGASTDVAISSGSNLIFQGANATLGGTNSILTIGNSGDTIALNASGVQYMLPKISSDLEVTGNLTIDGNASLSGNLTLNTSKVINITDGTNTQALITPFGPYNSGFGAYMQTGGQLIIGSGEGAGTAYSSVGNSANEDLYLVSDQNIYFATNTQSGWSSGKQLLTLNTSGSVTTLKNTLDDGSGNVSLAGSVTISTGGVVNYNLPNTTGGWARGFNFQKYDGSSVLGGIGMYGVGTAGGSNIYLGFGSNSWTEQSSAGLWIESGGTVKSTKSTLDDGSGNATFAGTVTISPTNTSGTQAGLIIKDNGSGASEGSYIRWDTASGTDMARIGVVSQVAGSGGDLVFYTNSAGTGTPTEGLRLTATNVLKTPNNTLDDNAGNATFLGTLTVSGTGTSSFAGQLKSVGINSNKNNTANTTTGINPAVYAYDDGSIAKYGMHLWNGGGGSSDWYTALVAPSGYSGWAFTKINSAAAPANQTDFTQVAKIDPSGNLTTSGTISVNGATGTLYKSARGSIGVNAANRWFTINDTSTANGTAGAGASIQFSNNATNTWELLTRMSSVGTSTPASDSFEMYYDGTGTGTKFTVFGNGKVTTVKNTLDDSSGNATFFATVTAPTFSGALSGNASTASNISNTGTVTLASATESNAITVTAPSYSSDKPVKLLNFNWYADTYSLGIIRSASTPSNGLGVYFNSTEIGRFTTAGLTLKPANTATSTNNYISNYIQSQNSTWNGTAAVTNVRNFYMRADNAYAFSNVGASNDVLSIDASGNLLANGTIQANGKFLAAEGAGTAGGYSFTADGSQDTGMFSPSDGDLHLYSNGVDVVEVTGTAISLKKPVTASSSVTASTFTSNVTTGTAPLTVTSTTKVTNLNVDMVDGYDFDQDVRTTASPTFANATISASGTMTAPTVSTNDVDIKSTTLTSKFSMKFNDTEKALDFVFTP